MTPVVAVTPLPLSKLPKFKQFNPYDPPYILGLHYLQLYSSANYHNCSEILFQFPAVRGRNAQTHRHWIKTRKLGWFPRNSELTKYCSGLDEAVGKQEWQIIIDKDGIEESALQKRNYTANFYSTLQLKILTKSLVFEISIIWIIN